MGDRGHGSRLATGSAETRSPALSGAGFKAAESNNEPSRVQGGLICTTGRGFLRRNRPKPCQHLRKGRTAGKSRQAVKSARSGTVMQIAHFLRLVYFPQTVFRCLQAISVAFFHNGKLRPVAPAMGRAIPRNLPLSGLQA